MRPDGWMTEQFEGHRARLRAIAYRVLGSAKEADDAVQDTWLQLHRADHDAIENLGGWLTTVVSRVCLNMLRARDRRREDPLDDSFVEPIDRSADAADPAEDAVLAESVGLAMMVVLDRLTPAERLAFVLHDMFDVPFETIATLLARSPAATRQLASRARRRVASAPAPHVDVGRQRQVADAYLAAVRGRDFDRLLALLDPDVLLRADGIVVSSPQPLQLRGAHAVAEAAMASAGPARFAEPALVNGTVGLIMVTGGQLRRALALTHARGLITAIDVIADPARLQQLAVGVLDPLPA